MTRAETCPRPSPAFSGTDTGDEYLFYDREQERVHVLNGTAREIYLLCDGERSMDEIVVAFGERYTELREVAQNDARDLLQQLAGLGLVVIE